MPFRITPDHERRREAQKQELQGMRDRGLSQRTAARMLNISKSGVQNRCRRLGIEWGRHDRVRVRVRINGHHEPEELTLAEIARSTGISYDTIYHRYFRYGYSPSRLVAPLNRARRRPPREYRLGLSMADWQVLLAEVDSCHTDGCSRFIAIKRVASRTSIPHGALAAADRAEWERLG